jgi:hypothetical protein
MTKHQKYIEIVKVAKTVRQQCEITAENLKLEDYDFYGYSKHLDCMCAIASTALVEALRQHGIRSSVVTGTYNDNSHCWVEAGNLRIDLTATQFKEQLPQVYITRTNDYASSRWYKKTRRYSRRDWPCAQMPTKQLVQTILRSNVNG